MTDAGPGPGACAATPPALATHYEQLAHERQFNTGLRLVDSLQLAQGERVLELGCGSGALARLMAERVGSDGDVLGLDPLPLRVQIAHQHSARNLRFQIGDVATLARFGPASFDAIVANGVLHRWEHVGAALTECARLLAPTGRLALATHSAMHPHPAAQIQAQVLADAAYAAHPPPAEAREYAVAATQLERLLEQAGFGQRRLEAVTHTVFHGSAEAAIESMQATAWGHFLAHLPVALRRSAHAEIVHRLRALSTPHGIPHDGLQMLVLASAPLQSPTPAARRAESSRIDP
jgi:ubiquinone/menaquinone biosynthesis C-methylase UbiE